MKLEEIRLAVSPFTERIYLGTVSKRDPETWNQKRDAMSDVLRVMMEWIGVDAMRPFSDSAGQQYEISIRKVSAGEAA